MTSIDEAIAQAKASASAMTTTSVPQVPVRKLTMDDLDAGSIDVASWMQVDEYGLHLAKTKDVFETLDVEIDLDEVVALLSVRFGKTPVQYRKTYDGVTTFGSGKAWEVTLREATQLDPTCKGAYSSAEIPMTLLNDVVLPKSTSDTKKLEAGTRVGHAPSVTGFKNWKKFWDSCVEKGLKGQSVKVRISYEVKRGGGNEWGVATYTLLAN